MTPHRPQTWQPPVEDRPRGLERVRDLLLGGDRGFGLWVLPMFLVCALIGATLSGALAVLYFGQQVNRLEAETRDARAAVEEARDEALAVRDEALAAIGSQVTQVEEALADNAPIEGPNEAGVYAVAASHANGERRVGSAFTIYSSRSETILITTYRLVATGDGFAVPGVEVLLSNRNTNARVHNFDRDLDVATLVISGGGDLPVLDWRPAEEEISRGDRLYLAGLAGPGAGTVLQGTVGSVGNRSIVPNLPVNDLLAGGPLLDGKGRVVAMASLNYGPAGQAEGDLAYGVPIREICRELIQCAPGDDGAQQLRSEGGRGAMPEPPREPEPPPPPPEPEPEPPAQEEPAADPAATTPSPPPPSPSPTPTMESQGRPSPSPRPTPTMQP